MDCDLQHPSTLLPELIAKWEEGYQVVATLRTYPADTPKKKQKSSQQFYKLLNLLSDIEIKEGSADFRLLDQSVVRVIRSMKENETFLARHRTLGRIPPNLPPLHCSFSFCR